MKIKKKTLSIILSLIALSLSACDLEQAILNEQLKTQSPVTTKEVSEESSKDPFAAYPSLNQQRYNTKYPEELGADWQNMLFALDGEVYDWMGKSLNEISERFVADIFQGEELLPGERREARIFLAEDVTEETIVNQVITANPFMYIDVFNDSKEKVVHYQDAKIVGMRASKYAIAKYELDINYLEGAILPQGITIADSKEKVLSLYGKAREESENAKSWAYEEEDKALRIDFDSGNRVNGFKYFDFSMPDFAQFKLPDAKEASQSLDSESIVYIGEKEFQLYESLASTIENLELVSFYQHINPEMEYVKDNETIPAGQSSSYLAKFKGFHNQAVQVYLYNPGYESVSVMDAEVTGIKISYIEKSIEEMKDQYLFDDNATNLSVKSLEVPVLLPYGIWLGDDMEEARRKAPRRQLKEDTSDEGASGYSVLSLAEDGEHFDFELSFYSASYEQDTIQNVYFGQIREDLTLESVDYYEEY